ncbi:unnamed protein product [Dibothriocephalus latus]|uniref:Uncharacterized protein n=1 Tax=Dibothriocephalus latus TaxID=60516 RepID=A0A3P6TRQ4_DIBLA|nr:unnamed protein product [Dibothriocephalus latus]
MPWKQFEDPDRLAYWLLDSKRPVRLIRDEIVPVMADWMVQICPATAFAGVEPVLAAASARWPACLQTLETPPSLTTIAYSCYPHPYIDRSRQGRCKIRNKACVYFQFT